MTSIFISYRRDDSRMAASRLASDLAVAFGPDRVSLDHDDLAPGQDLSAYVSRKLRETAVVLVLIGPQWLDMRDTDGRRRIDRHDDFVRFEIATALHAGLRVVPLLLEGAQMPPADQLPDDVRPIVERNCFELSSDRWRGDLIRLVQVLSPLLDAPLRPDARPLAGVKRFFRAEGQRAPTVAPTRLGPGSSAARTDPPAAPKPADLPAAAATREVFVSYAFEDEGWAQRIVGALEGQGYTCFVASRDIVPGSPSYARDVVRAIKRSRLLVVLLSAASNASDDVLSEITLAKNNKVPRLALRIDEAPLDDGFDYFFAQAQRLDAGQLDVSEALARLCSSVARQLGSPQSG